MSDEGPQIVVLGGGFAGAYFAQAAERSLRGLRACVLLVSRSNYFLFTPLLVEAGTGSLEPRHAVVSIRSFLRSARFRMAQVVDVDLKKQTVACRGVESKVIESVHYDHLVLALGAVPRLPDVPGLRERGFEMKSLADAVALRDRAIQLLEAADASEDGERRRGLLHFVVVGGNYTGVEVAGEFEAFLRRASRQYRNVRAEDCQVTLVELTDSILAALDAKLADFALHHLRRRGIDVRLETSVTRIAEDHVILGTKERLSARTVIWCAGLAPPPLFAGLSLPLDKRGYIRCGRDLRVVGYENIWAIGDCAANPDPQGKPYPATAQHAVQEGRHLARNLASVLRGEPAEPCDIAAKGSLAAFGCRNAVARVLGFRLSGFWAWFLWRTVYLAKMPGWGRRLRVALDWTMDLFFTRDYVELGVHRRPELAEDSSRHATGESVSAHVGAET